MKLLTWGRALHVGLGFLLSLVLAYLGISPGALVAAVAAVGIAHEVGDGDFLPMNGGPRDGVLDVLAFLPAPVLIAIVASLL